MYVEVDANPNCENSVFIRFRELGSSRPVSQVRVYDRISTGEWCLVIGWREGWSVQDSIYFAFVSGLTIGYGDRAPKFLLTRVLAVAIGICGVLLTALLAAVAVKALNAATEDREADGDGTPR